MAMFVSRGPAGEVFQIEAPDEASASQAVGEMMQGGAGQDTMAGGGLFDDLPTREEARGGARPAPPVAGEGGAFDDIGISRRDQFETAFDPSQDSPATAEGLDQNLNSEADWQGRGNTFANSLTMGFGDEMMGVLAGGLSFAAGKGFDEGYDKMTGAIRGSIDRYAERHPVEHAAVSIAGAIPTAAVPGAAAVRGATLGSKIARGAATGAGYGAVTGYAEGEGSVEDRVKNMAKGGAAGAVVGGAVPVVGNAVGKAVGKRLGRAQVPGTQQLDDAATALYQRADNAGVAVQPRALQRLTTILPQRMRNMDYDPDLHPKTAIAMKRLEEMAARGGPFSLGEVEAMRRKVRAAITSASGPDSKADRFMAQRMLDQFDMWMNGLHPRDMLAAGPISGREAIGIIQEARGLWSRKSKGDVLADMVERAQLDDHFESGLRREFRTLARNKERMRQFTKDEKDAIRKVARGGDMGWIMRTLGSLSPTTLTGGIRSTIGVGGALATGNPVLAAAIPAIGYAAKKVGDASTRRAADRAGGIVRSGGFMPISPKGKEVGDYATRLFGTAGQASAPSGIDVMFPNDVPVYR